jgi:adenylate cyclase
VTDSCSACGVQLRAWARFCDACGATVTEPRGPAEYKQVTVLFADVVHSMDIAAAVGAERLREMMAELFDRSSAVVKRYGGTVDKFTGDGIMAVFGAPMTLEDHAIRACIAALKIHDETQALAADVLKRDGIALQLRIGLNSGQVIAGEVGSRDASYTAVGEQVGMAQRMESIAPPGGVMLSEATARLVENAVLLGETELHPIKGASAPVPARRILAIEEHQPRQRNESKMVGRTREMAFLTALVDEAIGGAGCVVNIVGPPGIGKSRLARETAALAASREAAVVTVHCESHTSDVPFRLVSRMFRASIGIDHLDAAEARAQVRARFSEADAADLRLLKDLLSIADAELPPPDVTADARRRRLVTMINTAALAQVEPAVYVIEDVHWIDETSETLLAQFISVIPQTPTLVLITSRPEYQGALVRVSGAQTIGLRPLNAVEGSTLTAGLLGADPSLTDVAAQVCARAAGNPFFAEEMVRDLAERGVLAGTPGAYTLHGDAGVVDVPATLQATIGARIDRLSPAAKHTLGAAAVIGSQFDQELLADAVGTLDVAPLIEAELIDQVRFGRCEEYAFRHPLIRAVAYESQLKADRSGLHRRLARFIEGRDPAVADENAALIAEHFEAAGDRREAFSWHLRAGTWLANRDFAAARASWRRAQQIADGLPGDDPGRATMRIAPRALLCGTAHRLGGGVDSGFDELRELCSTAGDLRSMAIGLNGHLTVSLFNAQRREASLLADELIALLELLDDPILAAALSLSASTVKAETAEMATVLRLTERIIAMGDEDSGKNPLFIGSPVALAHALRGEARVCLGMPGWKKDFSKAVDLAQDFNPLTRQAATFYTYALAIPYGVLLPDDTAMRHTSEILAIAEHTADNATLFVARLARGITLVHRGGHERKDGLQLLASIRGDESTAPWSPLTLPIADSYLAQANAAAGDVDRAVEMAGVALDSLYESGRSIWCALVTTVLVEALLQRKRDDDLHRAQTAMDRLADAPVDPGFVLHEITLLRMRALLARVRGDDSGYLEFRDRYRKMADDLGFEGHKAIAAEM